MAMSPIPPRSSHFGQEVYAQFASDNPIELHDDEGNVARTLTFKDPGNFSAEGIEGNPIISLGHQKDDGEEQSLKFTIGRNTELFKEINKLSSESPDEQKIKIKALIL